MSPEQSEAVTVRDNPEKSRFEVFVAGDLAGFAEYTAQADLIDFTHTEVFEAYGGRGLAKTLTAHSLDEVRARGLAALPHCALFQRFVAKNPEYVDLVPEDRRAEFDLA